MSRKAVEIEEMRLAISKVYSGISWKRKCQSMSKSQVVAIYLKFKSEGRFDTKEYKRDKKYHQISIEEYMNESGL